MKYGLQVTGSSTLFPLVINAVQRTQHDHVELVIDRRFYRGNGAETPTGRVVLSPREAAALAEELQTMSNLGTKTEQTPPEAPTGRARSGRSAERPYEGPASRSTSPRPPLRESTGSYGVYGPGVTRAAKPARFPAARRRIPSKCPLAAAVRACP
jgi:hypothetical protein